MYNRRHPRLMNQINVVPYIDVMLVLLVIFMVTAPLLNPGEIVLPSMGSQLTTPSAPLQVRVLRNGNLSFRDQQAGGGFSAVSRDELLGRVRDKLARQPGQAVVIEADRGTTYENVLAVLDLLKRGGVDKVGLLAQPAAK